MDYLLKKSLVSKTSKILDTVTQLPVDLDFTLPDYCADMEKILKCTLEAKIYTRSFSGGQLRVDGASVVRIIYCDADKRQVRCCEQSVPFSETFPVSGDAAEHIILTDIKNEYLNCRALTPRRLTVHGAFSLHAAIIAKTVCDIYEDKTDDELQIKTDTNTVCELCEFSQETFNVSEAISIHSKSNVETIVRSELSSSITDVSVAGEKLSIRGEMTLRLLYICDAATGEVDHYVYVFPFTRSVAAVDSDCTVRDIRLDVLSYELLLRKEMMTEEPVVNLEAKVSLSLLGYKKRNIVYICDAYSTLEQTEILYETQEFPTGINPVGVNAVMKPVISLGDKPISRILDIFTQEPSVTAYVTDKTLSLTGKVDICVLGCTEDGELVNIERQADINWEEVLSEQYAKAEMSSCSVSSLSYRLGSNNDLELRFDIRLGAVALNSCGINQVVNIVGAGKREDAFVSPLTLYYAQKGESVWDIAKHYSACVNTICDENAITEDSLSQNRMLLILRA